jgi:type II secretory pathway pseudopilin PulG
VEVLAALLLMAIIIPVAMDGMSVASRAGNLGQRKAAAMRVAERVLNELIATNQTAQESATGTQADGDTVYPWTMSTEAWSVDLMTEMTVRVTFTVQGRDYEVQASTLFDPAATGASALDLL